MAYYSPREVKIVGDGRTKDIKVDLPFLEKLFFMSNTSLTLTLIGMPVKILESIKTCLEKFKYLSCELWLDICWNVNSREVKSILRLLNSFEKEADWYRSRSRLSIIPLIRLKNSSGSDIKRFTALKNFFKKRGLFSFALLDYRVPEDIKFFNSALSNPRVKNSIFLIYSERIDSNLSRLTSTHNNIFTLHHGLNRCIYKKVSTVLDSDCGSGVGRLLVHSGGDVYPCYGAFVAKHPIGNISEKSLEEILNSYRLPTPPKKCDGCQMVRYCRRCRFMPEDTCRLFRRAKPE